MQIFPLKEEGSWREKELLSLSLSLFELMQTQDGNFQSEHVKQQSRRHIHVNLLVVICQVKYIGSLIYSQDPTLVSLLAFDLGGFP